MLIILTAYIGFVPTGVAKSTTMTLHDVFVTAGHYILYLLCLYIHSDVTGSRELKNKLFPVTVGPE